MERNGRPVAGFVSRKAEALFLYLVCNRHAVSRETLAAMLWPQNDQTRALANLSVALNNLHKLLDEYVVADRHTIAFNQDMPYWLDTAEFESFTSRRVGVTGRLTRTEAVQVENALNLYQGPFLAGFTTKEADTFEQWALVEQERLHLLAARALKALIAFYQERGQVAQGLIHAVRLVSLDPLREESQRQLMRLYTLDGQRSAALRQYKQCQQLLDEELGVEPNSETQALYEQILNDALVKEPHRTTVGPGMPLFGHNLPAENTPFIGRTAELAQINENLNDPACRLLTVIGLGGVGKTRLALHAAAAKTGSFLHGVWFISLAGLTDPDLLVPTLAETLGLSFSGRTPSLKQLADFLREKEMLIILDNFEHLMKGADTLADLLPAAAEVKWLVTSRERLNLQAEWLLELQGLAYPANTIESLAGYGAVQLFIQTARRLNAAFDLRPENAAFVLSICQQVQGLPLGVELAATLTRLLTLEEITAAIQANADILATTLRDLPHRHRSLRAVFDSSWQLLTPAEQKLLIQLTIFRGTFDRQAVQDVAGANLGQLAALVDKSLLRQSSPGRYELHQLLHHFIREKWGMLAASEQERLAAAHAHYYLTFLHRQESGLQSEEARTALQTIRPEINNIHQAWQQAVVQDQYTLVRNSIFSLIRYYEFTGSWLEGLRLLETAASRWQKEARTLEALPALAALKTQQSRAYNGSYQPDQAVLAGQEAVGLAQQAGDQSAESAARLALGLAYWFRGDSDLALHEAEMGLPLAQSGGRKRIEAELHRLRGMLLTDQGHLNQADTHYRQAQAIFEEHPDALGLSALLNSRAVVAAMQNDNLLSREHFLHALRLKQAMGERLGEAMVLNNLGILSERMGDYENSRRYYEQAHNIPLELGNQLSRIDTVINLGVLHRNLAQPLAALRWFQEAVKLGRDTNQRPTLALALYHLGTTLAFVGRFEEAKLHLAESLQMYEAINRASGIGLVQAVQAVIALWSGEVDTALELSAAAVPNAEEGNHAEFISRVQLYRAMILQTAGRLDEAQAIFWHDLTTRRERERENTALEALVGLINHHLARDDQNEARLLAAKLWAFIEERGPLGAADPIAVYLACYRTWQINDDHQAGEALNCATHWLREQAAQMSSEVHRKALWEKIPSHQAIAAASLAPAK